MSIPSEQLDEQTDETVIDFEEVPGVECDAIQDRLEQTRTDAADNRLDLVRSCEQYVRDRPVKSLLIAAGIGLLFSRFWKRR